MKHSFRASQLNADKCILCGADTKSHTDKAECNICGTETTCDFFPDYKHKDKVLICNLCLKQEYRKAEEATNERVAIAKQTEKEKQPIASGAEYFVSNPPNIASIVESVNADTSIAEGFKIERICQLVREWIIERNKNIFEIDQKQRKLELEKKDELRGKTEGEVFLNHNVKLLSEEAIKRLQLKDLNYKPSVIKAKIPKVTPPKGVTANQAMRDAIELSTRFSIPLAQLKVIMERRQVSAKEAVRIYNEMMQIDIAEVK